MQAGPAEDALIPLSALQHQLFCPRQCALIHLEQQWAEDGATAEGTLLHERVDAGRGETRPGVRIARGVALRSLLLGIAGRADVVEFIGRPPRPFPVEYKRGKPEAHRADVVQLFAQAMCLEEMSGAEVPEGALFYGQTRRRVAVALAGAQARRSAAPVSRRDNAVGPGSPRAGAVVGAPSARGPGRLSGLCVALNGADAGGLRREHDEPGGTAAAPEGRACLS